MEKQLHLATFSERVIAFSADAAVFALAHKLSVAVFPGPSALNPHASALAAAWFVSFLLYQAYLSSEGRVSLGKRLLGLKVVSLDNEPLDVGRAVARALGLIPGSLLGFGYLWALFNPSRQAWHDMAAGSVVVARREARGRRLHWLRAGALGCLTLLGGLGLWRTVWAPRYYRIMAVAQARVGMEQVAHLQRRYRAKNGRYATSIFSLARVSSDPGRFLTDMAVLYDLRAGFRIEAARDGYTVRAHAYDSRRTPIVYRGA